MKNCKNFSEILFYKNVILDNCVPYFKISKSVKLISVYHHTPENGPKGPKYVWQYI
jgi:hypothetical protein